ncbi:MAG: hypothetical protein KDC79_12130 [Cyclobacteriaceae bacterium]|nr:hypothetical protein [Cyclobacteriaceae bacterium]
MKQSKTILILGIILAILSIVAISYEASTNYNNATSAGATSKTNDSIAAPLVEKTLNLAGFSFLK